MSEILCVEAFYIVCGSVLVGLVVAAAIGMTYLLMAWLKAVDAWLERKMEAK